VVRPRVPFAQWGLVTLLGGLAARTAVAEQLPKPNADLKWPNDVLVGGRKIAGVLAQLVPETGAIVLGVGINTAMTETELPVPTATSVIIERDYEDERTPRQIADAVVVEFIAALAGLVARFEMAGGDLDLAGLRDELEAACVTLGSVVDVELPDGGSLHGRAIGIGADGALLIVSEEGEPPAAILAGDVTHVRNA
jgi:BirA family biotin operon repressor/biotin-[acetyl-CoA-carboxylase] ligase